MNYKIGTIVDNVIDGLVTVKNCVVIGYHNYDKNILILDSKYGKFLAPINNCRLHAI